MSTWAPAPAGASAPAVPRQRRRRLPAAPVPPPAPRPALRGWLHGAATPAVAAAGLLLVLHAGTATATWTTVVFAAASTVTSATSTAYHLVRWTGPARALLQRLDHGNIPLMIAASATPVAVLGLSAGAGTALLAGMWTAAALAAAARWVWPSCPRRLHTGVSVALGWALVPALPALAAQGGAAVAVLVGASGLVFTAGGVVFAVRRPDPWPRWFGHHEVFHALTLLAWPLHGAAVALLAA